MMVPWFMLMCAVVNFSLKIWTTQLIWMGSRSVPTCAGKIRSLCLNVNLLLWAFCLNGTVLEMIVVDQYGI